MFIGVGLELHVLDFFFQAEDGIRDLTVTGVQTCALPISRSSGCRNSALGVDNLSRRPTNPWRSREIPDPRLQQPDHPEALGELFRRGAREGLRSPCGPR